MTTSFEKTFGSCFVRLLDGVLEAGNRHIHRAWTLRDGRLWPRQITHLPSARQWLAREPAFAAPAPAADAGPGADEAVGIEAAAGRAGPTQEPSLQVRLTLGAAAIEMQIFDDAPGIRMRLHGPAAGDGAGATAERRSGDANTGIEDPARTRDETIVPHDVQELLEIDSAHLRLLHVELRDQTDIHDELVFEREYLLHPNEHDIRLAGNVFALDDPLTGQGLVLLKEAPLPPARPAPGGPDLRATGTPVCWYAPGQEPLTPEHPAWPLAWRVGLYGHGVGPGGGPGEWWTLLCFDGGRAGRIAAVQTFQRQLRRYEAGRDGVLLSNTWGDRNRDSRIAEEFLLREIDAAAALGVDVVQIDDGWQKGTTSNSVNAAAGGVWEGFWKADGQFWSPHPQRLPRGLEPLLERATHLGLRMGLWFAPDSSDDFAHWQSDAEAMLGLHARYGIDYFKIDGVHVRSHAGLANLDRLFTRVRDGSGGRIVLDLDVTAQRRGGYYRFIESGPLFLENRYSDFHRWWPHHTLRNLWQLASWVDPSRLRIELLNPARHAGLYHGDPLAPGRTPPETIFAITMVAAPLGWFEVSNLEPAFVEAVAPLVALWKRHREAIHTGHVIPIGAAPDGVSWTGFASLDGAGGGHLLLVREVSDRAVAVLAVPGLADDAPVEVLWGRGGCSLEPGRVRATVEQRLGFVWARVG